MPNFKVVENSPPKWQLKYREFIELYNNPRITRRELLKELDWNLNQYTPAREQAIRDGLIPEVRKLLTAKYYYPRPGGKFLVERVTKKYFVRELMDNEEEAKRLVEYLHKHGWTMDNVDEYKRGLEDEYSN